MVENAELETTITDNRKVERILQMSDKKKAKDDENTNMIRMISSCRYSSSSTQIYDTYEAHCSRLKAIGRFRTLKGEEEQIGVNGTDYGPTDENVREQLMDLSTNDYLMMSGRKELADAAIKATRHWGVGSTGSRLLSGNRCPLIWKLERQIARDKQSESTLIFNTGFQANLSILSTLLDSTIFANEQINGFPFNSQPLVFFDRHNHSSLYHALQLAKGGPVECHRYAHNDFNHLESLLAEHATKWPKRPKFLVTESVFSMDGDILPMDDLLTILGKYPDLFVYLDETHATGLMGQNGYGLSAALNKVTDSYIAMGTFSKALGGFGAYVACKNSIRDYLINRCPGFIYTTALPPSVIGAASEAWRIVPKLATQRQQLLDTSIELKRKLRDELGLNIGNTDARIPATPIVPIVLGDDQKTMEINERLLRQYRINVSGIRAPTVPKGTARLRLSLTTGAIEDVHILRILNALKESLLME